MHQETSASPWGYEDLDAALVELAPFGPNLSNGFTNHAPMVVQALCEMGRGADITVWLEAYRPQLRPWPELRTGFDPAVWREALGRPSYVTAWRRHFESELTERPWTELLAQWTPRLAPGAAGAALHGLIRVGHAVRALDAWETAPRRRELAAALACWAASYAELPTLRAPPGAMLSPREALARVGLVPPSVRRNAGAITTALQVLDSQPAFAGVIDLPAVDGDLRAATEAFAVLFAEVFIANVQTPLDVIVFTHSVTGLAAADALLPHLGHEDGAGLIRYVWQAGAALFAAYGERLPPERPATSAADDREVAALIDAAVHHGDDHVIKLTHACLDLVARRAPGLAPLPPQLALAVAPRPHAEEPNSMTWTGDRLLFRAAGLAAATGALLRVTAAIPAFLPDLEAREALYASVDLLLLFGLFGLFACEPQLRRGTGSLGFAVAVAGFVLVRTGPRLGAAGNYQTAATGLALGLAIMGMALLRARGWARSAGGAWIAALAVGVIGAALHAPLGFLGASLLFSVAFGLTAVVLLSPASDVSPAA